MRNGGYKCLNIECGSCICQTLCGEPADTALGCMNRIVAAKDETEPKRGRWVENPESDDGYKHHMCNKCKTNAPFHYTYIDDYDEGLDGEWFYLGQRDDDIEEHMGNFCPNCGADMRGVDDG